MYFMIFMTFYLSLLFTYLSSPLAMGVFIIALTIMTTTIISIMAPTSWFSFLLIMIFLSGMMIVFVYVCSLAANELSFIKPSTISLLILVLFSLTPYNTQNPYSISNLELSLNNPSFQMMYKIYTYYMYMFTIFLIIYLLLALIVVVKNSAISHAPFRMK